MTHHPQPTDRELEILKILWELGEATVRTVYEEMSKQSPIVQNTVQAFLRTMETKGLVQHHLEGRSFVYRPVLKRQQATNRMISRVLNRVFDGAVDQLVQSVLEVRKPTAEEIKNLETMIRRLKHEK